MATQANIEFENYKLLHNFTYPNDPLKRWINEGNYTNIFKTDWNELMRTIRIIEQLDGSYDTEEFLLIRDELCTGRIETTYSSVVDHLQVLKQ